MKRRYHLPGRVQWSVGSATEEDRRLEQVVLQTIREVLEGLAAEPAEIIRRGEPSQSEALPLVSATRYHAERGTFTIDSYRPEGPPSEEVPVEEAGSETPEILKVVTSSGSSHESPQPSSKAKPPAASPSRQTLRESYAVVGLETGPIWDVSLTITNLPGTETEESQDFVKACMEGISDAAASLGSGARVKHHNLRLRLRYRQKFDYAAVSSQAFLAARRSVKWLPTAQKQAKAAPPAAQPSRPRREGLELKQIPVPAEPATGALAELGLKQPSRAPFLPEEGAYPHNIARFCAFLVRGGYIKQVEKLLPLEWGAMTDAELTAWLSSRFSEAELKKMYLAKYAERASIKATFRQANIVAALVIGLIWARENIAKGELGQVAAKVGGSAIAAYALNRLLYAHDISAAEKMARYAGEYGRWFKGAARTNRYVNFLTRRVGTALLLWDLKDIFMSGGYGGPNIPFDVIQLIDLEDPSTWQEPNQTLLDFGFDIWYQQKCTPAHPEACGPVPIYLGKIEGSAAWGLLKVLDIAPHDVPEIQKNLYRIEGEWIVADFLILAWARQISAAENILVVATGRKSGELFSGRGHYRALEVKPANEAAVQLFGNKEPRFVPEDLLHRFGRGSK